MPNEFRPNPLAGVYAIVNDVIRKAYVGQSNDVGFRWTNTTNQLNEGIHTNRELQADWKRYGVGGFSFKFVQFEQDTEKRLDAEKY